MLLLSFFFQLVLVFGCIFKSQISSYSFESRLLSWIPMGGWILVACPMLIGFNLMLPNSSLLWYFVHVIIVSSHLWVGARDGRSD